MKIIYLDQNKWIELSQGWYSGEGETYNLVKDLKKKIENKEIIFVISLIHVIETMKRKDKKSRERLWNFMIDLSEGNGIAPFSDSIKKMENINLLYKRVPKIEEINIKQKIMGKGLPGIIGMVPKLVSKIELSEKSEAEFMDVVYSTENLRKVFSSSETVLKIQKINKELQGNSEELNEVRAEERNFKDKNYGIRIITAKHLIRELFSELYKITMNHNLSNYFFLKEGATKKDIIKLFQELPMQYTYFCLTDRRDRNLEKDIDDHDLLDIFSFSMAIPYCDIVFGEKMFISLAKQAKLGQIYNTILVRNLTEFKNAI